MIFMLPDECRWQSTDATSDLGGFAVAMPVAGKHDG
jgi:hypothetical protein